MEEKLFAAKKTIDETSKSFIDVDGDSQEKDNNHGSYMHSN